MYLLGEFYVSGSILVLARNQSLPVLFTPSLTEREHVFSGTLNEEEISRKLHVNVTSIENLATFLASQTVHTPSNLELVHENLHDYQRQLRQNNVTIIQNDLLAQLIVYSRFYKTDSELFALEYASQVAARAHEKIKSEIANSKATESILASQFSLYCAECSARLQAYNPIVGVGKHAAVLHFPTGESWDGGMTSIPKHAFVLIDAAPQWRGYASDLTRTYAASVTPEMKRIHHIVARAQKTGIQSYYVGGTWKGLVDKTVDSLLIGLVDIGLIHGEWTELREREVIKVFMPHGVGHPVGLDVHDPIPKRFYNGSSYDYVLANGMVHTVEPGIYFIPYLLDRLREDPNDPKHELIDWELLDTYLHVGGVRIEDVIAIDNQGKSQIFTKAKRFIW